MLAYRTDEDAARLVAEQLERETADVWRENVVLANRLARMEVARDAALERLSDAGPGGARPSARRDRIGVGALALVAVALAAMALQIELICQIMRATQARPDPTLLPVVGLLGVPGVIAAFVGYRYRRRSIAARFAFALGVGVAISAVVSIVNLGGA